VLAVVLAAAAFPVWLALVVAMLFIGAVVSNNEVGFDYESDDDDDDIDYDTDDGDDDETVQTSTT